MKRSTALWAAALLCLIAPAMTRAEPAWSYFWTTTTPLVGSNGKGVAITPVSGSGAGGSDIGAANLAALSSAPAETPDPVNGNWNLTLHLTDTLSGNSGTLLFTGHFSGTVSATAVNVENAFGNPTNQSLPLGGHLYGITIGLYMPPDLPGSLQKGGIGANLALSDLPGGTPPPSPPPPLPPPPPPPPVRGAPEPSGLTLAVLGASFLGLGRWWRGRQRRGADLALE